MKNSLNDILKKVDTFDSFQGIESDVIFNENGTIKLAYAKCYRKGRFPIKRTVLFSDVKDDALKNAVGLQSLAEIEAIKTQFPMLDVNDVINETPNQKETPKKAVRPKKTKEIENKVETKKDRVEPTTTSSEVQPKQQEPKLQKTNRTENTTVNAQQPSNQPSDLEVIEGKIVQLDYTIRKNTKTGEDTPIAKIGFNTRNGLIGVIAMGQEKVNLIDEVESDILTMKVKRLENTDFYLLEEVVLDTLALV